MNIHIVFAAAADLPYLADFLTELFTLKHPDRDKQLRGLRIIFDEPVLRP